MFTINHILLGLIATLAFGAVFLLVLTQNGLKRTASKLKNIENEIEEIKRDLKDLEKAYRLLLYLSHQMKTTKNALVKPSGNGHRIHA